MNRISLKEARILFKEDLLLPKKLKTRRKTPHEKSRAGVQRMALHARYITEGRERKVTQYGEGAQINLVNIRDKSIPREETGRERRCREIPVGSNIVPRFETTGRKRERSQGFSYVRRKHGRVFSVE